MDLKLRTEPVTSGLDLVFCPECQSVAHVEWRDVHSVGQVSGLVKIRCPQRHWFLMLGDTLLPA